MTNLYNTGTKDKFLFGLVLAKLLLVAWRALWSRHQRFYGEHRFTSTTSPGLHRWSRFSITNTRTILRGNIFWEI